MSRRKDWGDVFRDYLAKGMDHADAAFRADEWDKRRPADNAVQAKPYMDICEQLSSELANFAAQLATAQARLREAERLLRTAVRHCVGSDGKMYTVSAFDRHWNSDCDAWLAGGAKEGE